MHALYIFLILSPDNPKDEPLWQSRWMLHFQPGLTQGHAGTMVDVRPIFSFGCPGYMDGLVAGSRILVSRCFQRKHKPGF